MSNYLQIGNYTKITYNQTYGKNPGKTEQLISLAYISLGYHIEALPEDHAKELEINVKGLTTWKYTTNYQFIKLWQRPSEQYVNTCKMVVFIEKSKKKLMSEQNQFRREIKNVIHVNKSSIQNNLANFGINDHIQIGSEFDYLGIEKNPNYTSVVDLYSRTFVYNDFIAFAEHKAEKPWPNVTVKPETTIETVKALFTKK